MGQKSGLFIYYLFIIFIIYYLSVNIKPPRHRFDLSLCLGLAIHNLGKLFLAEEMNHLSSSSVV